MIKPLTVAVFTGALLAFAPAGLRDHSATAQQRVTQTPPNRGGFTTSMGLPPTWRWSMGAMVGTHRRDGNDLAMYFHGGFYRDIMPSVTSALGFIGEGYGGRRGSFEEFGDGWDGGLRAGFFSPAGRLAFGWDYNFEDSEADFFLSLIHRSPSSTAKTRTDRRSLIMVAPSPL